MVINTNIAGPGGILPDKSSDRAGSKPRTGNDVDGPSGAPVPANEGSQVDRAFVKSNSDILDSQGARGNAQNIIGSMFQRPGAALMAQANLSADTVLSLLEA